MVLVLLFASVERFSVSVCEIFYYDFSFYLTQFFVIVFSQHNISTYFRMHIKSLTENTLLGIFSFSCWWWDCVPAPVLPSWGVRDRTGWHQQRGGCCGRPRPWGSGPPGSSGSTAESAGTSRTSAAGLAPRRSCKQQKWSEMCTSLNCISTDRTTFIMHPARPSKARLGGVHIIDRPSVAGAVLQKEIISYLESTYNLCVE